MSLLSGGVGQHIKGDQFRNKLHQFSIIEGEDPDDYSHLECIKNNVFTGTKLKENSLDTISHVKSGRWELFCLGYNEYLNEHNGKQGELSAAQLITNLKKSDGEWIAVVVEDPDLLHIITDRFSSRPCFYYNFKEHFFFSTNMFFLLELIPGEVTFDKLGLLQLLSFDHTINGRTTINEVRRVRPGEHIVCENGKIKQSACYYNIEYTNEEIKDYKNFADEVYDALKESVEKRTRGKSGFVSLSGGLDSRLLASAVNNEKFSALTFVNSLKDKDTVEVKVARKVADRLDLDHSVLPVGKTSSISDSIYEVLRLTGGQTMIHHPIKTMLIINHILKFGFHLGGGPGDTLAGAKVSVKMLEEPYDIKDYSLKLNKYPDEFILRVFKKARQKKFPEVLKNSLRESLEIFDETEPARKINLWNMRERQAAFTFNSPIHNHPVASESSPHTGYGYTNRMLQLKSDDLQSKNFYKFMCYHSINRLRDVKYANSNLRLRSALIDQFYDIKFLARLTTFSTKVNRRLQSYIKRRKKKKPDFHYEMVFQDKEALTSTKSKLLKSDKLKEILDIEECLSFLDKFKDGHIEFSPSLDANFVSFLITITHMEDAISGE